MEAEITYPFVKKYSLGRIVTMQIFMWLFIAGTITTVVINILVGGIAWSAVAVFGMWWLWTQFIHTNTISYNRISQFVKGIEHWCILLIIIVIVFQLDWGHWINFIFPIVIFPTLTVLAILLFTDFRKQKHNIIPLITFDFYCLVGSVVIICIYGANWPVIVLTTVSTCLLLASIVTMRLDILKELKKYFSIK